MHPPSQLQPDQSELQPVRVQLQLGQSELQLVLFELQLVCVQLQPGRSELQLVRVQLQPGRAQLQPVPSNCNWSILPIAIGAVSQLQLQGVCILYRECTLLYFSLALYIYNIKNTPVR